MTPRAVVFDVYNTLLDSPVPTSAAALAAVDLAIAALEYERDNAPVAGKDYDTLIAVEEARKGAILATYATRVEGVHPVNKTQATAEYNALLAAGYSATSAQAKMLLDGRYAGLSDAGFAQVVS